jgi:hypothetical protein
MARNPEVFEMLSFTSYETSHIEVLFPPPLNPLPPREGKGDFSTEGSL